MERNFSSSAVSWIVLTVLLAGCAPSVPLTRGRITQVAGEIQVLEDGAEADALCETQLCEPNYVYTASFGRSRPQPAPAPVKPPSPAPEGVPVRFGENIDYSKRVLRVSAAWNISQGSPNVVVAVVDTGIDLRHSDLVDNLWVNEAEAYGRPGVDDDGNGYVDDVHGWDFVNQRPNGQDDEGHGTHVAGIVAASDTGYGVVGVAPNVKVMALKFLDSDGSGDTASAVRAIRYAIANGAHIISNSWGGGGRSTLLDEAIQEAHRKGILVTAASGNERSNNDSRASYPASYAGVISVASSDENDRMSSFSNYGKSTVTLAASGSNILSTYLGGGWMTMSGTSMATPQVSGVLALAKSLRPGMSRDKLMDLLCDSSYGILRTSVKCGRLDAYELLLKVKNAK